VAAGTKARINKLINDEDDQLISAPKQKKIKYLLSLQTKAPLIDIVELLEGLQTCSIELEVPLPEVALIKVLVSTGMASQHFLSHFQP
jgi:hypothetical protein|tara:strand:- start:7391 stop:7654 length:264 start_codon:yes stop_codon:yes gene_type:complete